MRPVSIFLLVTILCQICFPTVAYALSGGPSQPEVQSFEPANTTQMVDLFTGDFNYNIPLLDVDEYPINISYHSGISMDQEASWVGLGWNINPGVVNRNMRGIPDDFKGGSADNIERRIYMKPTRSYGLTLKGAIEIMPYDIDKIKDQFGASFNMYLGVDYDNYKGLGFISGLGVSLSGMLAKKILYESDFFTGNLDLDLMNSSKNGVSHQANIGFRSAFKELGGPSLSGEMSINSRTGLQSLGVTGNVFSAVGLSTGTAKYSHGVGTRSYTPNSPIQMWHQSVTLALKNGGAFKFASISPSFTGYFHTSAVAGTYIKSPAYGYLYAEHGVNGSEALSDFNREKDGTFCKSSPVLAVPVNTYDMYGVTGQGIGGVFRAFRNDCGFIKDRSTYDYTDAAAIVGELSMGTDLKVGINCSQVNGSQYTGHWKDGNGLESRVHYQGKNINDNPLYEPSFFKMLGESNVIDDAGLIGYTSINSPISPKLVEDGTVVTVDGNYLNYSNTAGENTSVPISNRNSIRQKRVPRKNLMTVKTVGERDYCTQTSIKYYEPVAAQNVISALPKTMIRNAGLSGEQRPSNHISEVTVVGENGVKYVYGIPAYNYKQVDFTFTNANDPDETDGDPDLNVNTNLVDYDKGNPIFSDLSSRNFKSRKHKGLNHFFESSVMPEYAHSYLLTEVHSPDYTEYNSFGPSSQSGGTYTKIGYYLTNSVMSHKRYKWRVPIDEGKAYFNPGYKSVPADDMATFSYGEKDNWLVRSIEGINHIAYFYISARADGCGVKDINGGIDVNANSYKLDSIVMYSKKDMQTPVKAVHFEYNNILCQGVSNNKNILSQTSGELTGKLTLKRIYFTYGNSRKGMLNSYLFEYGCYNPDYHPRGYDRWGNFKEPESESLNNTEYPYVNQNKTLTDKWASAWCLTKINMPSGSSINIVYESDDYAYVQDKVANQMYKIVGFSKDPNISSFTGDDDKLYEDNFMGGVMANDVVYDYIYFTLPSNFVSSGNYMNDFLGGSKDNLMYFNCFVNITSAGQSNYEYVKGYASVVAAGVSDDNRYGWVRINKVGDKYNPISFAAWQLGRLSLTGKVFPGSDLKNEGELGNTTRAVISSLLGYIGEIYTMIDGVNDKFKNNDFAREVNVEKSFIRLNNLTGYKLGGGSRVKSIIINDDWSTMTGNAEGAMSYGQEFSYTKTQFYNGADYVISSGVASYEPIVGGDENPFRQPDSYEVEHLLVPNDNFYTEQPYGESFFPPPVVGYSEVAVKTMLPEEWENSPGTIERHAKGKTLYSFYTAKDYPIVVSKTSFNAIEKNPDIILSLTQAISERHLYGSQGFQVELNDMHGKPRGIYSFDQQSIDKTDKKYAYSGITYNYSSTKSGSKSYLKNDVLTIDRNNTISTQALGMEVDVAFDSRETSGEVATRIEGLNINMGFVGIIPFILPMVLPERELDINSFKSVAISRVINRYGILEETVANEFETEISQRNMLYDAETGDVLLTCTTNEFDDDVHSLTLPAYWMSEYDGMGPASMNIGLECYVKQSNLFGFEPIIQNQTDVDPAKCFVSGDMVELKINGVSKKAWIYKRALTNEWIFIDAIGSKIDLQTGTYYVKVMDSGRKNLLSLSAASITSLASPIVDNKITSQISEVINAQSQEYKEHWGLLNNSISDNSLCNYVFDTYVGSQGVMLSEFKDIMVPKLYRLLTANDKFFSGQPGANLSSITRSAPITEGDLDGTTKLKGLYQDYQKCQGLPLSATGQVNIRPAIECKQSGYFNPPVVKLSYYIDFILNIGTYSMTVTSYEIRRNVVGFVNSDAGSCYETSCNGITGTYFFNLPTNITSLNSLDVIVTSPLPNYTTTRYNKMFSFLYNHNNLDNSVTLRVGVNDIDYATGNTCGPYATALPIDLNTVDFSHSVFTNDCSCFGAQTARVEFDNSSSASSITDRLGALFDSWATTSSIPSARVLDVHDDIAVYKVEVVSQGGTTLESTTRTTPNIGIVKYDIYSDCGVFTTANPAHCKVNPFLQGLLGNWKSSKSWVYMGNRTGNRDELVKKTNIRKEGTYVTCTPFWSPQVGSQSTVWSKGVDLSNNWKMQNENTKFHRSGVQLESKNTLNQFSSQLIDVGNNTVYASSSNARYNDIANDNMENYVNTNRPLGASDLYCPHDHFNFMDDRVFALSSDAHTGLYSMKLQDGQIAKAYRDLENTIVQNVNDANGYVLSSTDYNGWFNPAQGEYVVSCWVKIPEARSEATYDERGISNLSQKLRIEVVEQSFVLADLNSIVCYPVGPIIDGWQKMEGKGMINRTASNRIEVRMISSKRKINNAAVTTLFDDLRIHPAQATMKTYVYNRKNLRLMSELDENNYAVYYEYNNEGKLVRTKRETDKGVFTISETRSSLIKK